MFITQVVEVWAGMASALRLPPPHADTPNALLAQKVGLPALPGRYLSVQTVFIYHKRLVVDGCRLPCTEV